MIKKQEKDLQKNKLSDYERHYLKGLTNVIKEMKMWG